MHKKSVSEKKRFFYFRLVKDYIQIRELLLGKVIISAKSCEDTRNLPRFAGGSLVKSIWIAELKVNGAAREDALRCKLGSRVK